jgi:hypothetical protein
MERLQLLVHQTGRLQLLDCQMEKLQVANQKARLLNLIDSIKPVLNI